MSPGREGDHMNWQQFKGSSTLYGPMQYVYRIETDQKTFTFKSDRINYKETIKSMAKNGYTNISIACLGRAI